MIAPDLLAALAADDTAIVVAIVAARLLVPLLIPRFPLVIIAALVLDGIDNSLLAASTEVDFELERFERRPVGMGAPGSHRGRHLRQISGHGRPPSSPGTTTRAGGR